jgi:hypothetical protein
MPRWPGCHCHRHLCLPAAGAGGGAVQRLHAAVGRTHRADLAAGRHLTAWPGRARQRPLGRAGRLAGPANGHVAGRTRLRAFWLAAQPHPFPGADGVHAGGSAVDHCIATASRAGCRDRLATVACRAPPARRFEGLWTDQPRVAGAGAPLAARLSLGVVHRSGNDRHQRLGRLRSLGRQGRARTARGSALAVPAGPAGLAHSGTVAAAHAGHHPGELSGNRLQRQSGKPGRRPDLEPEPGPHWPGAGQDRLGPERRLPHQFIVLALGPQHLCGRQDRLGHGGPSQWL